MNTLSCLQPASPRAQHPADPRLRRLAAQWQLGPDTFSGFAQRKLRLSFVSSPRLTGAKANQ